VHQLDEMFSNKRTLTSTYTLYSAQKFENPKVINISETFCETNIYFVQYISQTRLNAVT